MLKGKVAVITGGTRGIGFATAKLFLENHATVVIAGSSQESAKAAEAKLKALDSSYVVEGIWPTITKYDEVKASMVAVKEKYGRIDILISNAGITRPEYGNFYDINMEKFEEVLDVNFRSGLYFAHVVAPFMKEQGGGSIVFTASITAIYGSTGNISYPTSKFALRGLSRCLAMELAKDQIRVNCVAPGCTSTDMINHLPEKYLTMLNQSVPLGKVGDPEDIAESFLYLVSERGKHVTGIILPVAGGGTT